MRSKCVVFIIGVAFLGLMSCSKEDIPNDCIENFLIQYGMQAYEGGEIPCGQTYMQLYAYYDGYFAYLNNDCADLVQQEIYNCDGDVICSEFNPDDNCFKLLAGSESLGIFGVSR